jgi:hypothetical protein
MPDKNPQPAVPKTTDEKILERLDEISMHMKRLDTRDRWRTAGSTIRGVLSFVPFLISVWFAWYLYAHFDDVMRSAMRAAAEHTMEATKNGSNTLMDQLKSYFQ